MKGLLILIIAVCGLASCKKSQELPGLIGKWELRRQYGGFSYRDSVYAPGNKNIYQFYPDSTYKRYDKDVLAEQGTIHIQKGLGTGPERYDVIFYDSGFNEPISIKNNTLTLGTTVTDGIASDYQKIAY